MSGCVSRRDVMRLLRLIDGSLRPRAHARLRARLDRNPELARAHERLLRARSLLRDLGDAPAPELSYRQIEAQVRWRTAQDDEMKPRASRARNVSLRPLLALGAAAVAGSLCTLAAYHLARVIVSADRLADRGRPARPQAETVSSPQPNELAALATLAAGEVTVALGGGDIVPLDLNRPVLVGERVITGADARVTLQWGQGSGVDLRSRTELEVRRLDAQRQVLALWQGQLRAQVEPAARRGQLVVLVGPLRVSVTGTSFGAALLSHAVEVEVYRGVVQVSSTQMPGLLPDGGVAVPRGSRLRVGLQPGRGAADIQALSADAAEAEIHLQPWPNLHRVLAGTGLLTVETNPPGATLRFDTVDVGRTNLELRGSAGRHLLELWRDGRLLRREWVLFRPSGSDRLALDVRPPRAGTRTATLPKGIYDTFRWRARQIRSCYERRLKRDPTLAGKLVLRVRVDEQGHVDRASLDKDTLDDPVVGRCAVAVVRRWRFPADNPVEVVYPFSFQPAR